MRCEVVTVYNGSDLVVAVVFADVVVDTKIVVATNVAIVPIASCSWWCYCRRHCWCLVVMLL